MYDNRCCNKEKYTSCFIQPKLRELRERIDKIGL